MIIVPFSDCRFFSPTRGLRRGFKKSSHFVLVWKRSEVSFCLSILSCSEFARSFKISVMVLVKFNQHFSFLEKIGFGFIRRLRLVWHFALQHCLRSLSSSVLLQSLKNIAVVIRFVINLNIRGTVNRQLATSQFQFLRASRSKPWYLTHFF